MKSPCDTDETPPIPQNWDRCHAYNHRKRRYCRQMPAPQSKRVAGVPNYCGNHMHLLDDGSAPAPKRSRIESTNHESDSLDVKGKGRRIPCPIDPSHLIFESALHKHVHVCPAAKHEQEVASQEYYIKNVNRGGFGIMEMSDHSRDTDTSDEGNERYQDLALAVLRVFCHVFMSSGSEPAPIEQLKCLTEQDMYNSIPEIDLSDVDENRLDEEQSPGRLTESIKRHRIKAGGPRHVHQIASILGHIRQNALLISNGVDSHKSSKSLNVIEMGAGRGMLGLVVAAAAAASTDSKVKLYLVDRSGSRAKADTRIRNASKDASASNKSATESDCLKLDAVEVTRIKADLSHVHLPTALPFLADTAGMKQSKQATKTIVIAKHLCGSGTDLALKSLSSIAPNGSIDGCVMATCCHGLCDWNDYTGRDTLLTLFCSDVGGMPGFQKRDFDVMKRWTSASVLEDRCTPSADAEDEHTVSIETDDKSRDLNAFAVVQKLGLSCGGNGLGRACQRLIDYGRCQYMKKTLFCGSVDGATIVGEDMPFDVHLFHYVSKKVTPQNALLMAYKKATRFRREVSAATVKS